MTNPSLVRIILAVVIVIVLATVVVSLANMNFAPA